MFGVNLFTLGLWLFQEGEATMGFDIVSMWRSMAWPARAVVGRAVHHVMLVHRRHD